MPSRSAPPGRVKEGRELVWAQGLSRAQARQEQNWDRFEEQCRWLSYVGHRFLGRVLAAVCREWPGRGRLAHFGEVQLTFFSSWTSLSRAR